MKVFSKISDKSIPRHFVRSKIAEAIHRSVCEETGSDGLGHCLEYALVGSLLLNRVFGRKYYPQAGSLTILTDPPNGCVKIDARDGGIYRGEFHCWLGRPEPNRELVDFSSRHFRSFVEQFATIQEIDGPIIILDHSVNRFTWTLPDPDSYIWTNGLQPVYAKYEALPDACEVILRVAERDQDRVHQLSRKALSYYLQS